MRTLIGPHMRLIGRFALLLSLWTTADSVIDLVFEAPEATLGAIATEEPDNAAEHVLMPSARTDSSTDVTVVLSADPDSSSSIVSVSTRIAASSVDHPPRNSPVSFSVPLRI